MSKALSASLHTYSEHPDYSLRLFENPSG